MTKVQIKKNQYKGALPRQAKPAIGEFRPSAVGKKLNEVMCAVGKMLISSKSRAQILKTALESPEREISYTGQQNQIPQIKNRNEKNDNSECKHLATPIKNMHAKQNNSSFLDSSKIFIRQRFIYKYDVYRST